VEVTWDQLDDVSEPVLPDRCNYVNRDFAVNVLSVALV
jgi:hypothetical protein